MAEKTLFGRLKRLFNTNVIVRKVGKDKLRVIDNDHLQSMGNPHNSRYSDRFTRLHGVTRPLKKWIVYLIIQIYLKRLTKVW